MSIPSHKELFLDRFNKEHETTLRVLRAYPQDKLDLRPHGKCKNARELAWLFALEQGMVEVALTTGFDWSKPSSLPPAPESFEAIVQAVAAGQARVARLIEQMPDEKLGETVSWFGGPRTPAQVRMIDWLWFVLGDHIHHRGQFSIYLRMADGKVPSIYGPTADEPWM
jgi:uncharacterized damage-inducible protein DinB